MKRTDRGKVCPLSPSLFEEVVTVVTHLHLALIGDIVLQRGDDVVQVLQLQGTSTLKHGNCLSRMPTF